MIARAVCCVIFILAFSSANAQDSSSLQTAFDLYLGSFFKVRDEFNKGVVEGPSCSSYSAWKEGSQALKAEGVNFGAKLKTWSRHMLWWHPYWYATVGDDCTGALSRFEKLKTAIDYTGEAYLNFFSASCRNDQDPSKVQIDSKTVLKFKIDYNLIEAKLHMLDADLIMCEELASLL